MQNLQVIEIEGQRVLTTRQLAEAYKATTDAIKINFNANKQRYTLGKHYIALTGDDLRQFKNEVRNPYLVAKQAKCLYLWTEKGALLHAKSLNTDKAWEVYDWLVDFYFRVQDQVTQKESPQIATQQKLVPLDIPGNQAVQERMRKVNNLCTSVQCVMELYNRYIEQEEAAGLQKTLYALGAGICSELFKIGKIKLVPKV